jgi:hypothetical protein
MLISITIDHHFRYMITITTYVTRFFIIIITINSITIIIQVALQQVWQYINDVNIHMTNLLCARLDVFDQLEKLWRLIIQTNLLIYFCKHVPYSTAANLIKELILFFPFHHRKNWEYIISTVFIQKN